MESERKVNLQAIMHFGKVRGKPGKGANRACFLEREMELKANRECGFRAALVPLRRDWEKANILKLAAMA